MSAQADTATGDARRGTNDQPRTNLEKQQTEQNGEAVKYGDQGAAGTSQPNHKDKKAAKDSSMSSGSMSKQSGASMKKDGTSSGTDTTSTPTPTNTVNPTTTK